MTISANGLARMTDSTHISTLATKQEVDEMIQQAKQCHFYAINGPASYFPYLVEQLKGSDTLPNFGCTRWSGADPSLVKAYAAKWAVSQGAKEIDMVMNISFFKSGLFNEVVKDIRTIKDAIGNAKLKTIIECPFMSDDEIRKATALIIEGGADCVKTCTGTEGPCTIHHVEVIAGEARGRVWIKAAGGIRTLETVNRLLDLGVARFGINYKSAKKLYDELLLKEHS